MEILGDVENYRKYTYITYNQFMENFHVYLGIFYGIYPTWVCSAGVVQVWP